MMQNKLITFYSGRWARLAAALPDLAERADSTLVYDRRGVTGGGGRIMAIGEAPGGAEVAAGEVFVGPAGKNLDKLLERSGLSRGGDLLVTNAFPCRTFAVSPTGERINRTPTPAELRVGMRLLEEEMAIVRPAILLILGNSARKALSYASDQPFSSQIKGLTPHTIVPSSFAGQCVTLAFTFHPSPLNYNVPAKRTALEGFFDRLACEVG